MPRRTTQRTTADGWMMNTRTDGRMIVDGHTSKRITPDNLVHIIDFFRIFTLILGKQLQQNQQRRQREQPNNQPTNNEEQTTATQNREMSYYK